MTKLLVSVRDAAEATIALEAGVDLIDIKEPRHGSLGKADDSSIENIAHAIQDRRPLSVALGELIDYAEDGLPPVVLPAAIRYAKIGLAGCGQNQAWPLRLAKFWQQLPPGVHRIAVIYADWQAAGAPDPWGVLQQAQALNAQGILIDTFDKSLPALAQLWTASQIQAVVSAARAADKITVLAGRISADDVAQLLLHAPDYIAVRGAVCRHDRNGAISASKICAFRKFLAASLEFA